MVNVNNDRASCCQRKRLVCILSGRFSLHQKHGELKSERFTRPRSAIQKRQGLCNHRVSNPPDCADPGLHPDQRRDDATNRPNTGRTVTRASVGRRHLLNSFVHRLRTRHRLSRVEAAFQRSPAWVRARARHTGGGPNPGRITDSGHTMWPLAAAEKRAWKRSSLAAAEKRRWKTIEVRRPLETVSSTECGPWRAVRLKLGQRTLEAFDPRRTRPCYAESNP